jgi:glycosyltransferase involved in cell wall biosynthesis
MSRNATVPFFSVVVATYNRAPLLERALSSLQRQQWQDWEAIIVDDGSTDGTAELLRRFCTHDPRMRCYRTVHQGAGAARRYGIARARGQFVTFWTPTTNTYPSTCS